MRTIKTYTLTYKYTAERGEILSECNNREDVLNKIMADGILYSSKPWYIDGLEIEVNKAIDEGRTSLEQIFN